MDTSGPYSGTTARPSSVSSVIYSNIPTPQFVLTPGTVARAPQSSTSSISTPMTSAFSMTPSIFSPQVSTSGSSVGVLTSISSEIAVIHPRFPSPASSMILNLRPSVTTVSSIIYTNPSVGHITASGSFSGSASTMPSSAVLDTAHVREPSEDGIPTARSLPPAPLAALESGALEIDEQDGSTSTPRVPSRTYTVQSYFPESFKSFYALWYASNLCHTCDLFSHCQLFNVWSVYFYIC